ncbi:MAG: hypothetical protein MRY32_09025 [Rickettsiales bacterium]|nr:hypothetical protein [Rickettsiales bacterium]
MSQDQDGYGLMCAMMLLDASKQIKLNEVECACAKYLNHQAVIHLPDLRKKAV